MVNNINLDIPLSHIENARFAGNFYRMLGKFLRYLPSATSGSIRLHVFLKRKRKSH